MQSDTESKQEKKGVKFFYPKALSYNSLRKALKSGITKKKRMVIKEFECNCDRHTSLYLALTTIENKNITHGNCEFIAKTKEVPAINSEGKILLESYRFYSKHPNWKVRVANTIGLSKFTDEQAVEILSNMLNDKHWNVKLAAIQALEVINSEPSKNALQKMLVTHSEKRFQKLAYRAMTRSKFGINPYKIYRPTLYKLLGSAQARKIHHRKSKTNKILVSRRIFYSFLNNFNKNSVQKNYNHRGVSSTEYGRQFNLLRSNQQNILVKNHHFTKGNTKKNKVNYLNSLFFKKVLPVDHFERISNPIAGEIYWAITDGSDPKVTRPLLIVKVVNPKTGDFLAMSLTSDTESPSNDDLLIEINGTKSKVQISRQRIIHQSLLLNKYGSVSRDVLDEISIKAEKIKPKTTQPQRFYSHKHVKSNKPSVKLDHDPYNIDIVPMTVVATPKVSMISSTVRPKIKTTSVEKSEKSTRRIIRLIDFFKPEDYSLIIKASDSNNQKIVPTHLKR